MPQSKKILEASTCIAKAPMSENHVLNITSSLLNINLANNMAAII